MNATDSIEKYDLSFEFIVKEKNFCNSEGGGCRNIEYTILLIYKERSWLEAVWGYLSW